jgi:hypothetical protein
MPRDSWFDCGTCLPTTSRCAFREEQSSGTTWNGRHVLSGIEWKPRRRFAFAASSAVVVAKCVCRSLRLAPPRCHSNFLQSAERTPSCSKCRIRCPACAQVRGRSSLVTCCQKCYELVMNASKTTQHTIDRNSSFYLH